VTVRRLELDPARVKALAHPLRLATLRFLELHDRASVTSLAAELGETTGTVSYHLRQLARHGLVEQCPPEEGDGGGVGRPQVFWRMAADELHVSGFALQEQEDTREAAGFLLRESTSTRARQLQHWFATAHTWPEEWRSASSDRDGVLVLSRDQTRALADELAAVVTRYREAAPGPGARRVEVQYAVFPSETGDRP
jgi:DNA-binding transcriptional ArsR family regulator